MEQRDNWHLTEDIHHENGRGDPFAAIWATRIPMVITDPRQTGNPIVFVNEAFQHFTGFGREEIIGRNCRFVQGPGTDPASVERLRTAIRTQSEVQKRMLALEEALEAKDLLLHEVDHRVKNNLTMIGSLLRLQSRQIGDAVVSSKLNAMLERADALATVHRRLYQSDDVTRFDIGASPVRWPSTSSGQAGGRTSRSRRMPSGWTSRRARLPIPRSCRPTMPVDTASSPNPSRETG